MEGAFAAAVRAGQAERARPPLAVASVCLPKGLVPAERNALVTHSLPRS